MVDMGMGQDQRVDVMRAEGEVAVIEFALGFRALHHAAIHQHFAACGFEQKTGAGHRAACAVEMQFHLKWAPVCVYCLMAEPYQTTGRGATRAALNRSCFEIVGP